LTFNEPQVFVGVGHFVGVHAPFVKYNKEQLIKMSRNILKAHGKAVKIIRQSSKLESKIGMAPTGDCFLPKNDSEEAICEAREKTFTVNQNNFIFGTRWWLDPIFLGEYPKECYEEFGEIMPNIKGGDMELISQPLDFYGYNVYQATASFPPPSDTYDSYAYQGSPRTSLDWNITPSVLYWSSKFLFERYKKPILITENGMAGMDWVHLDGRVHDTHRIDFMHRYLLELKRAVDDGIDIMGFTYWSIMDNFEWAHGYDKRFGLVYVDYQTQKRTIKDSGYWYKTVIECNGKNL
jgi:beta-glucosidase